MQIKGAQLEMCYKGLRLGEAELQTQKGLSHVEDHAAITAELKELRKFRLLVGGELRREKKAAAKKKATRKGPRKVTPE